jgi:DNA invertase Pin-like site-specific DNA recombinase
VTKALAYARSGDVLVAWRLDRLGRSLKNLIDTVHQLAEREVRLVSLREAIDTTTSSGRLVLHIFGSIAELERGSIKERTASGLAAARSNHGHPYRARIVEPGFSRHRLEARKSSRSPSRPTRRASGA